jgi:hypothetical protein
MSQGWRFLNFLAPIAFIAVGVWSSPSPPTSFNRFTFTNPYQISNNGDTLKLAIGSETDYNIDISGLQVDLKCAESVSISSIYSVRVDLLRQGCARIIGVPANSTERNAQAQAQVSHLGLWTQPSGVTSLYQWIKTHKIISYSSTGLFLALISSPFILKLCRWIIDIFYRKKVRIILAGVASVGKTGLWTAWKDEYTAITQLHPTVGMQPTTIAPVMLERWTLHPTLIDAAGGEAWHVLKEIQGPRGLRGIIGTISRRRTKRVLVYVVAPCPQEDGAIGATFDAGYVGKQEGYASLPMAIIRQSDPKIRPDLVIMFGTKFDILSGISPNDSDGTAIAEMQKNFTPHLQLISSACTTANIPFAWIIGSAKRRWNIDQLRKCLGQVIDSA